MTESSSIYGNMKCLVNNVACRSFRVKNSCHASKLLPNFYESLLLTCNRKPTNNRDSQKMLQTLINLRFVQKEPEKADKIEELYDKLMTSPSTSNNAKIVEFLFSLFLQQRCPAISNNNLEYCGRYFCMEPNPLSPGIFGLVHSNRRHSLSYPSEAITCYFPLLPLKLTSKDRDEGFEDIEDERFSYMQLQNLLPTYNNDACNYAQFYATELDPTTFNNFYALKFVGSLQTHVLRSILSPERDISNLNSFDLSISLKYLLFGVSSGIFVVDQVAKEVTIQTTSQMAGYTKESLIKMLDPIAEMGTNILLLDHFIASEVNTSAATFRKFLMSFQKHYLSAKSQTLLLCESLSSATALLNFIVELDPHFRKFKFFREIIDALIDKLKVNNEYAVKVLLNLLYDVCCTTSSLPESSSYPDFCNIAIDVFEMYFRNVHSWINHGECDGINDDFFIRHVQEFSSCYDRRFWTKKFALDESKVPNFIKPYVNIIFDAGRTMCLKTCLSNSSKRIDPCYKNSISPTSGNIFSLTSNTDFDSSITLDSQSEKICIVTILRKQMEVILRENISDQSLAKFLLKDCKFFMVFQFFRELYFGANSNFSSALTHGLFSLLKESYDDNLYTHLSVFNQILNCSVAFINIMNDIDFGAVNFNFDNDNIEKCGRSRNTRLTDLFDLSCELRWPFNLIISENSLQWMRNVFKFLLGLRWAVVCMEDCWHYLRDRSVPASIQKRHQLLLCQREMKHYISQLEYYVLHQIVEVCWSTFDNDLKLCKTLDDIYNAHNRYINDIVTRCLLTPKAQPIFRSIHKLLDCAICFRRSLIDDRSEESALANYSNFVVRSRGFVIVIAKLADRVYQPHLNELLIRLNYNYFYF